MVTVTGGSRGRDAPAACPLKDHSFTRAWGEQAKWLRSEHEKRRNWWGGVLSVSWWGGAGGVLSVSGGVLSFGGGLVVRLQGWVVS
jgi:hypothetical protein